MGIVLSSQSDIKTNTYLDKFTSECKILSTDEFWLKFTNFEVNPSISMTDSIGMESKFEVWSYQLLKNNQLSGNLGSSVDVLADCLSKLTSFSGTDKGQLIKYTYNVLIIIRYVLKSFADVCTEQQFLEQIEFGSDDVKVEKLLSTLFAIICDVPCDDTVYWLQSEAVTILLILLSCHLYDGKAKSDSIIYTSIVQGKNIIASKIIQRLIENYTIQTNAPLFYHEYGSSGVIMGLASGLWSMFGSLKNTSKSETHSVPLATNSLFLLLVLVHNWNKKSNPFRDTFFSCANKSEVASCAVEMGTKNSFAIDFDRLYTTLCKRSCDESATLLLYLLIHQNFHFRTYLLSRTDFDILITPILKILYSAPNHNSHHIYMSLIIILILSENDGFNRRINDTMIHDTTWYTERILHEISLGGLVTLIVIRTIQYNMLKMRDKYLHTNCLAALANMSSHFHNLHPYVSQRFLSLIEMLAKRYHAIHTHLATKNCKQNGKNIEVTVDMALSEDPVQDVIIIEDVLRMLLEVLNSCLSNQLINNPHLLYTLLYKKNIFNDLKKYTILEDIINNIDIIITYFTDMLTANPEKNEVDASRVLAFIVETAKYWPKERLINFPDLKFKYVEEAHPEDFFIPYIWTLISQYSLSMGRKRKFPFVTAR